MHGSTCQTCSVLTVNRLCTSTTATPLRTRIWSPILAGLAVGRLVVTGAQTDVCIRSTLHGALTRGYDATLVEDAHTTEDMRMWGAPIGPEEAIAYTNLYWKNSTAPGRVGGTTTTAEVDFAPTS